MAKKWLDPPNVTIPEAYYNAIGGHPLVAKTMLRRGILDIQSAKSFLDPDYYSPAPPGELPGIDQAVDRIQHALAHHEQICVWGDFDVDGQTATSLLISTLHLLNADPIYHIPIRREESHGVNLKKLKDYLSHGVEVLLTCDTGISSHGAIDYAQSRGVDVIITDHHKLPDKLPTANAIVNPKFLRDDHPLANLPGVGVAYKLAESLLQNAGLSDENDRHLDLVALGIVADVAIQSGDTRYLLQRGLIELQNTSRIGLKALMAQASLPASRVTEEHIAFVLAPRLNALGRLSDANLGVELLTTNDAGKSEILANRLEGLNARRKILTDQIYQAALSQMEREPSIRHAPVIILSHPSWPSGVIGIVASRLVEHFHKPTILFSTPPDMPARGSARSIGGLDITTAIATQREILDEYGGHPMAAGLKIIPERIPEFSKGLIRAVGEMISEKPISDDLKIDSYLPLHDLTGDLVIDLERLAPFGAGNPALVLVSPNLTLKEHKTIGRHNEHVLLTVEDQSNNEFKVIWWTGGERKLPKGVFDLAYKVRTRDYRGADNLQIEYVDTRFVKSSPITIKRQSIDVVDHRGEQNSLAILRRWQSRENIQVWSEAEDLNAIGGSDRYHLTQQETLIIWTIPPSNRTLQSYLDRVSPDRVILFANNPGLDEMESFLHRLTGLIKYSLGSQKNRIKLQNLSAAMAHLETTVQLGLAWMEARGFIRMDQTGDQIVLGEGNFKKSADLVDITTVLNLTLDETAAYREYYTNSDKDHLIYY